MRDFPKDEVPLQVGRKWFMLRFAMTKLITADENLKKMAAQMSLPAGCTKLTFNS
jgi:hypothetical protein